MEDNNPRGTGNDKVSPVSCHAYYYEFPGCNTGRRKRGKAEQIPWQLLRRPRQWSLETEYHREESCTERKKKNNYLQRVHSSGHRCVETTQSQRKDHLKGLKDTMPGIHTGPLTVPTSTIHIGNFHNSQATRQSSRETLASVVENNYSQADENSTFQILLANNKYQNQEEPNGFQVTEPDSRKD